VDRYRSPRSHTMETITAFFSLLATRAPPTSRRPRKCRQKCLLQRQPPRHVLGVSLRHIDHAIDRRQSQIFGKYASAISDPRNLRAFRRLAADNLDRRFCSLRKRDTPMMCRSCHAADKVSHRAAGIAPDFRSGALVMCERIMGLANWSSMTLCPRRAFSPRHRAPFHAAVLDVSTNPHRMPPCSAAARSTDAPASPGSCGNLHGRTSPAHTVLPLVVLSACRPADFAALLGRRIITSRRS